MSRVPPNLPPSHTGKNATIVPNSTKKSTANSSKSNCLSTNTYIKSAAITSTKMKNIDVPGDGSCLFWAVALNYLLPVARENVEFQRRFQKLFGTKYDTSINEVQNLLQTTQTDKFATFNRYPILNDLVTNIFRNEVVDFILTFQDRYHFKNYIETEETLRIYLTRMRRIGECGGNLEIVAMQYMLNCKFYIVEVNEKNEEIERKCVTVPIETNIEINLAYISEVNKIDEGHYNFRINVTQNITNVETDQGEIIKKSILKGSISSFTISSNSNAKSNQTLEKPNKPIKISELEELIKELIANSDRLKLKGIREEQLKDLSHRLNVIKSYFNYSDMVIGAGFKGGLNYIWNKYGAHLLQIRLLISNYESKPSSERPSVSIDVSKLEELIQRLIVDSDFLKVKEGSEEELKALRQRLDIINSYFNYPDTVIDTGFQGRLSYIKDKYYTRLLQVRLLLNLNKKESEKVFKGMTLLAQMYKVRRAYNDIYNGTKFNKAGLPKFNTEHPLLQVNPIKKQSEENIKKLILNLQNGIKSDKVKVVKINEFEFGLRADEEKLYKELINLPYKLQHATNSYYSIMNQGSLDSYTEINRRDRGYTSSFSTNGNVEKLGNNGFVFFRVYVDSVNNSKTRYGDTSITFDLNLLKDCGWISLHDQLKPFSTPGATHFYYDKRLIRMAEVVSINNNTKNKALHDGLLYKYRTSKISSYDKGKEDTQKSFGDSIKVKEKTRSFLKEIFYGKDILPGIALSIIRELRYLERCGFRKNFLSNLSRAKKVEKGKLLGNLIKDLFRIEGKYPVGLRSKSNLNENGQWFTHIARSGPIYDQKSQVINPDGDGSRNLDNTISPKANHIAKLKDEKKKIKGNLSIFRRQRGKLVAKNKKLIDKKEITDNKSKIAKLTKEIDTNEARLNVINIELVKNDAYREKLIKYFCRDFSGNKNKFAKVDISKLELIVKDFIEYLEEGYTSINKIISLPRQKLILLVEEPYYELITQEEVKFNQLADLPYETLIGMADFKLENAIEKYDLNFDELVKLYNNQPNIFRLVTSSKDLTKQIYNMTQDMDKEVIKYIINKGFYVNFEWIMNELDGAEREIFKINLGEFNYYTDESDSEDSGEDQLENLEHAFANMMKNIKLNFRETEPSKMIDDLVTLSFDQRYNNYFQQIRYRRFVIQYLLSQVGVP